MTDGVKTGAAIKVPGPADDGRPPVRPVGISQNPVRTVSADGDCRKTGRRIKRSGGAGLPPARNKKQDGFLRPASEINYELWSSSSLLGLRLFFVIRIGFSLLCFLFGLFLHQKDGFLFFDALMSFS